MPQWNGKVQGKGGDEGCWEKIIGAWLTERGPPPGRDESSSHAVPGKVKVTGAQAVGRLPRERDAVKTLGKTEGSPTERDTTKYMRK